MTLRILQEKSVFEIVNVSKDCTDDKLHKTYHELFQKILFTVKSGGLCYQNYLWYIISKYLRKKDLKCAVITTHSGFIKTAGRN